MPPVNFEPQSKILRTLALSPNKQGAYNTALVAGALSWLQRFDGAATFDVDEDRRSDKEYAGKGSWWATNSQPTRRGLKINGLKSELTPGLAAWLCAYCMGKVVTTGAAAPYSHVFTFDQTTRQAPVTSVYLEDTDDLKYMMADAVVSDFTLTIPANGSITADYNLLGTGRYTLGAAATLPALSDEDYFLGSDADLSMGNVGAATSTLGRLQQATLKVDHQHIDHRATGIGLNAGFIRKGDPKFDLQFSVYTKDTDDVFTRYVNNTKTALAINVPIGATASLGISIPAANLKPVKMGWDGDATIWNIEVDETTSFLSGAAQPLTITITNAIPAFLTPYVAP